MKHKLSGYAIKGDGTQETAERIRKVFEADGWKLSSTGFDFREVDGCYCVHYKLPIKEGVHCYRPNHLPGFIAVIPLTRAERIVFGDELKVGMKVVFTDDAKRFHFYDDQIHEIISVQGKIGEVKVLANRPSYESHVHKNYLRRATITDFLRTLPEDMAERALRQVDEKSKYYTLHPEDLPAAVAAMGKWDDKAEGYQYWNEVAHGNYDRAHAILSEDRVGKWWKSDDLGEYIFCNNVDRFERLHGYGVSYNGRWMDTMMIRAHEGITPATPEEVEAMLDEQRVKMGFVEGAVVKSAIGSDNKPIGAGSLYLYDHTEMYDKDGRTCIMKKGKWAEIITPAPEKPEPSDKFPRVMWVYNDNPESAVRETVFHAFGEKWSPRFFTGTRTNFEVWECADDTHPVTGEPAVKKDVVEMIREVVENDFTTDFYKVNEIKEIVKNE